MKRRLSKLLLTITGAVLVAFGGSLLIAQTKDSAHINDLLEQVKSRAVQANHDADSMVSFTRSRTTWVSHARKLESMKEHINSMGSLLTELTAARAEGSPWQQEAIDQIEPLLRSMADHLSIMIDHLNANQSKAHLPEYVNYTKANLQLSDKMLAMIEDYVDYAQAKGTVEDLEKRLNLAAPASGGY